MATKSEKTKEEMLKELTEQVRYFEEGELYNCNIVLKNGNGVVVGQVLKSEKDAKKKAFEQAAQSAIEYLKL